MDNNNKISAKHSSKVEVNALGNQINKKTGQP